MRDEKDTDSGFDPEKVLTNIGGDQDLLDTMIEIYLSVYAEDLALIESAIEAGDPEEIRKSAHRMKGSVGNFGECNSFLTARKLEEDARSGNTERISEVFNRLVLDLRSLEDTLKKYVSGRNRD